MKNYNYNLVKMLFVALDDSWRIDKYYLKDAKACPHCQEIFKKMKKDINNHCEMLRNEIVSHSKSELFK